MTAHSILSDPTPDFPEPTQSNATYASNVIPTDDDNFPFMAIITDASGTVVADCLVRTQADGEAKVLELLRDLQADPHEPRAIAT
jgi:hypothetical protein